MSHEICIGGVSDNYLNAFHFIRFIDKKDIDKCKYSGLLIGSLRRNGKHDDARADKGEATYSVEYINTHREPWTIGGDDLKLLGLAPGEKNNTITGSENISLMNRSFINGNILSYSISLVRKNLSLSEKINAVNQIRENLRLPDNVAILAIKNVDELVNVVNENLCRIIGKSVISFASKIRYQDRLISCSDFSEFKTQIRNTYFSNTLNLDYLFTKPVNPFINDNEFRVLWIGHSGKSHKNVVPPLIMDYQNDDFRILKGIDFCKYFSTLDLNSNIKSFNELAT